MRKLLPVFVVMALAGASALAGSFTSNFSDPNQLGFVLTSNGAMRPDGVTPFTPVVENGHLVLTYNETGEIGTIVLDDLDGGQPIESFTAKFKLRIGPGSGNPADGTSFCFGPDINSTSNFSEEGTGTGIIVCFDIYDNGLGEAPAVDVKYGGATLATTKFAKADMVTSKFEDVFIQLTRAGTLNVGYKGQVLYTNLVLPDFAPTAGQFALGARTGGQSAIQWIDDLDVQTVVAGAAVAPAITANPQSQTIQEGADVTFTVGFDGSAPLTFEWYKNNTLIAGANGPSLTLTAVLFTDNQAKIKCKVSNAAGSATSQEATLTVVQDLTAPTLVSAKGSTDFLGVVVTFSEPVADASGGDKNNYTIAGLTVNSATVLGAKVVLATSKQAEGATYTVAVSNVKDRAVAGNTIAPNSQVQFKTFVFMLGKVLHKKYNNIDDGTGGNPDNLLNDPRYPNQPDRQDLESRCEYPPDGNYRVAADPNRNYFDTLEGFFIPPQDGNYVFFTAGADRWWLYLSTDEDPANKYMIAAEPGGWTDPRFWNTTHDTDPARHRSDMADQFGFNLWPTGPTITLTGGKRYYMLEVHHDPSWAGGDWFAATYKLDTEDDPADGDAPRLTGSVVGCYVDPSGSSVTITQQPADATEQEGRSAKFTVLATGTSVYGGAVSFQWQRQAPGTTTWANIGGATAPSYSTPLLALADNGAKYRVVCTVPGVTVSSDAATLTVIAATLPPKVVAVGSILKGATVEIGVGFDQNVDVTSASKSLNYVLSQGVITGVRYEKYAHTGEAAFFQMGTAGPFYGAAVVLSTSGLAPGDNVTVTVKNVKNLQGYAMSATGESKSLTITRKMKWAAMGGNDYLEGNLCGLDITPDPALWPDDVVAYSEADFDLISSGSANWNNYDEATFVYEEVTGDFDKVVRVEYHDPTSQWARAGLCATPSADEGVTRADVDAGARMEKRFMQRANPALQWNGAAGNNAYEADWRLTAGGNYDGTGGGTPAYPSAWLRMQRAGQVFTAFYSNDGAEWTQYGSATFTAEPMPDTLLVGPYYSPEMCNNSTAATVGHSSVAKFRDWGNYQAVRPRFTAWRINANGSMTIEWTGGGTLQSAPTVLGPWTDVPGAASGFTFTPTEKMLFGRIKKQ
jgi:hypothetical protein